MNLISSCDCVERFWNPSTNLASEMFSRARLSEPNRNKPELMHFPARLNQARTTALVSLPPLSPRSQSSNRADQAEGKQKEPEDGQQGILATQRNTVLVGK